MVLRAREGGNGEGDLWGIVHTKGVDMTEALQDLQADGAKKPSQNQGRLLSDECRLRKEKSVGAGLVGSTRQGELGQPQHVFPLPLLPFTCWIVGRAREITERESHVTTRSHLASSVNFEICIATSGEEYG